MPEIRDALLALGLRQGDTLIVHASARRLVAAGHTLEDILDMFFGILGATGTLVMPLFSAFAEEPPAERRFDKKLYSEPFVYRLGKIKVWTGRLPQVLAARDGAKISDIPLNTIVAAGANADRIVPSDAKGAVLTPCGPHSPWAACLDLDAKILMLDAGLAHSLTMIHVAEDLFPSEWPIENWYRPRLFRVISEGRDEVIHLDERDPKWALYYCEARLNKDLQDNGIFAFHATPQGVSLAMGRSEPLVRFLRTKQPSGYPYLIPSRYRKAAE